MHRRHGESVESWAIRLVRDPLLDGEPPFIVSDLTGCPQDALEGARGWLERHDPIRDAAERLTASYDLPGGWEDTVRAALLAYELELTAPPVILGQDTSVTVRKRSGKRQR